MAHQLIRTEDGSTTLYVPELNEHYHSVHGAIQESMHIFIRAGLDFYLTTPAYRPIAAPSLSVLEAGFGTGLNAYLSLLRSEELQLSIDYHSIEKYPLPPEEVSRLDYPNHFPAVVPELFAALHKAPWDCGEQITPLFHLHKHRTDFRSVQFQEQFDIVYFDAFNPEVQPHLWTAEVLGRFARALKPGGILVTYCVKGIVKQALREVGFTLKRLPGPPGKREMLRATKPDHHDITRDQTAAR